MADSSKEQPEQTPESNDAVFDQSMIDGLLQGNSDETTDKPEEAGAQPEAATSGPEAVNQDDIDAILQGKLDETPEKADAQPVASAGGPEGVDQDDIDALLQAATAGKDEAVGGDAPSPPAQDADLEAAPDSRVDTLGRPFDAAAAEMQEAMEEQQRATAAADSTPALPPSAPAPSSVATPLGEPLALPELILPPNSDIVPNRVKMLCDVDLPVRIELGRTEMLVEEVLKLDAGSVVELDKLAGDPVDVFVNERLVARGEVLVLNDSFCVRISEVLSHDPHRVSS